MEAVLSRLEAVTARLEGAASKMGAEDVSEDGVPQYVKDYEAMLKKQLAAIVKICGDVKVKKCGTLIKKAFNNSKAVVTATASCKKPSAAELQAFMKPMADAIADMEKEKMRRDKKKQPDRGDYRAALYEVCVAASWVTQQPPSLPVTHVTQQLDSFQFHANRALKKEKSDVNKAFSKACQDFLKEVTAFVKANFKAGLSFRGKNPIGDAPAAAAASAAAPADDEKKEEPAKKKKTSAKKKTTVKKEGGGMGNVMGELSKGLKVTSGLKKVSKDQKTKYRKKEAGRGLVKTGKKKAAPAKKKKKASTTKQPGRIMFLDYSEGVIEVPDEVDMKTNAFISGCSDCGMDLKGKIKAVSIEGCKNFRIAVDQVVSTVEMVNCKNVTVYVKTSAPSIQIDKTESPRIIVMHTCKEMPNIITSMVTAGNVELPDPEDEKKENLLEYPIPEQFALKPKAGNKGLEAHPVEH